MSPRKPQPLEQVDFSIRNCSIVDQHGYVAWVMPGYSGKLRPGAYVGTKHATCKLAGVIQVKPCPIMGGSVRTYYAIKGA